VSTIRVFVAAPRDESLAVADVEAIRAALVAVLGTEHAVEAVAAVDEWNGNFTRCGGWNEWKRDVGAGYVYGTTEPRYRIIVVTTIRVGRATRDIVDAALGAEKPVLYWDGSQLCRVVGTTWDTESWKDGARVTF